MTTIRLFDLLARRALIARESARPIRVALANALAGQEREVVLDFEGVEAVTPSFVDELLTVVDDAVKEGRQAGLCVVFLNPPTRLSAKFAAVGRGHGLRMKESEPRSWTITAEG